MPNVNNPHGLRPLTRTVSGGAPQGLPFLVAAGYASAIFRHDPVTRLATGYLAGTPSITPGTTPFLGVAEAMIAASPAAITTCNVICSPTALFEAQDDGSTGPDGAGLLFATMGCNANLTFGTAGGGINRDNSGAQIAASTAAVASTTLDVKLIQLLDVIDNSPGQYARCVVMFNRHQFGYATAGI